LANASLRSGVSQAVLNALEADGYDPFITATVGSDI